MSGSQLQPPWSQVSRSVEHAHATLMCSKKLRVFTHRVISAKTKKKSQKTHIVRLKSVCVCIPVCLHAMCVCARPFSRHRAPVTVKGSLLKKHRWWREEKMNKGVRPFASLDFQLFKIAAHPVFCFFPLEGCWNKIKLVSACGKRSPWMRQATESWLSCERCRMQPVPNFRSSCVTCLQMSALWLNDCCGERQEKKGISLIRWSWKVS